VADPAGRPAGGGRGAVGPRPGAAGALAGWVAEAVAPDENGADWLAREHWESVTGKPYPARPARRRRLPGLSR
jgi:hypothetical protein